jgi:hypothetical protein
MIFSETDFAVNVGVDFKKIKNYQNDWFVKIKHGKIFPIQIKLKLNIDLLVKNEWTKVYAEIKIKKFEEQTKQL